MSRLALLPADAFTSVASFLTSDDILPLAACSRSLLTVNTPLTACIINPCFLQPLIKSMIIHGLCRPTSALRLLDRDDWKNCSFSTRQRDHPPSPSLPSPPLPPCLLFSTPHRNTDWATEA